MTYNRSMTNENKDPELVEDEQEEFGDKIIELPEYDGTAFELGEDDEYIEVIETW